MNISSAMVVLRIVLVLAAILFGMGLGRSLGTWGKPRLVTWILRVSIVMLGICWRGLDMVALAGAILALAGIGFGYYQSQKPRAEEHLERVIFPEE